MFFTGDNLVVIAGYGSSRLNDVEYVSTHNNNNLCNPMDLDYRLYRHESVSTDFGILTCGGSTASGRTSKCTLLTKEGQTTSFPSMRRARDEFGLGIVNDFVYAVGGSGEEWTMEKMNYKTDSEWTLMDLPFGVRYHCLTTTTSSIVITGGWYNWEVSKIILSFVNENKKMKIKERINQLQKNFFGVS